MKRSLNCPCHGRKTMSGIARRRRRTRAAGARAGTHPPADGRRRGSSSASPGARTRAAGTITASTSATARARSADLRTVRSLSATTTSTMAATATIHRDHARTSWPGRGGAPSARASFHEYARAAHHVREHQERAGGDQHPERLGMEHRARLQRRSGRRRRSRRPRAMTTGRRGPQTYARAARDQAACDDRERVRRAGRGGPDHAMSSARPRLPRSACDRHVPRRRVVGADAVRRQRAMLDEIACVGDVLLRVVAADRTGTSTRCVWRRLRAGRRSRANRRATSSRSSVPGYVSAVWHRACSAVPRQTTLIGRPGPQYASHLTSGL